MVPFVVSSMKYKNSVVVSDKFNSSVVYTISTESFFNVKCVLVSNVTVVEGMVVNVEVSVYSSKEFSFAGDIVVNILVSLYSSIEFSFVKSIVANVLVSLNSSTEFSSSETGNINENDSS